MATLPILKTQRFREVPRKLGNRTRKIAEAFFVPGPNAKKYPGGADKFICPGGPGLGPIPKDGRWYDVTVYLLRCVLHGDAAEGTAEQIQAHKKTREADDKPAKESKKTPKAKTPKAKE